MQEHAPFLTTREAASYLRLKERKLYELVARRAVPCTKTTGRWLFPKHELDRWLASSVARPPDMPTAEPPPIVGGSHDPLLEWALRESGCGLAGLAEGSEAGLARFVNGGIVAAAIHLHTPDAAGENDANVAAMRGRGGLREAVLVGFLRREQGIVVAAGNPLSIGAVADLAARGARLAPRPDGAGAQLLLLALLARAGLALAELSPVLPPCPTGADIAQAIRAGRADAGIATRSVATAAGLGFVPLVWERFDLAMRPRDYFRPPLQRLLTFARTPALAARAAELGGYDVSRAGEVRYAP